MVTIPDSQVDKKDYFRDRHIARNQRLKNSEDVNPKKIEPENNIILDRKAYIQAAILRAKAKRS